MTLLSVQPFGVGAPGGGPRILSALFADPPRRVVCVCTGTTAPPPADGLEEVWLASRPRLGRLERTRLAGLLGAVDWPLSGRLARRIVALGRREGVSAIHAVAHTAGFAAARRAAAALGVPFLLSVHDDVRYALTGDVTRPLALRQVAAAWRSADARFVISTALGREYDRRYGPRGWSIVTDGLADGLAAEEPRVPQGLRVYFAGLFHRSYTPNFAALLAALGRRAGVVSLTCRCGAVPPEVAGGSVPLEVLPFASEATVRTDLQAADLLYLPLPFASSDRALVRYSLSTKLITYLGSGLPILYHGPPEGAAFELLRAHGAAIFATSPRPDAIAAALACGAEAMTQAASNALDLARADFRLADQRARFWSRVSASAPANAAPKTQPKPRQ